MSSPVNSILLLRKSDCSEAERIEEFLIKRGYSLTVFSGTRADELPMHIKEWKGDLILSFITPWIYPETMLNNARFAAINFHPGPPEYPGTGCTNFAIYEGANMYGATCHHMLKTVDSGNIIAVDRFKIDKDETVVSLTKRSYEALERMLYAVMDELEQKGSFSITEEKWARSPFTRKQLNALCEILPTMDEKEIERRIRATTYLEPWAFVRIGKYIFKLDGTKTNE